MPGEFVKHEKPIPYFTSSLFDSYGIKHCFTTRRGGVSEGVFESLNFAAGKGKNRDTAENIYKNHDIAARLLGLAAGDVCRSNQQHTDRVEIVTLSHKGTGLANPPFSYGVDGLVTVDRGLALSVRSADCVPVLLYDVKTDIAGAVHSGWQGAKKKIAANAVEAMRSLGGNPTKIIAALGPCIKPCCYEVGLEFYDYFKSFPQAFSSRNGKTYFDPAAVVAETLAECGLKRENIQVCPLCTCCANENAGELFFSYRRQGAERGTMSAFIAVRSNIRL